MVERPPGELRQRQPLLAGTAYLDRVTCLALKNGYQRQRAAAALELAILKPGRPLFEVRAPGFRQQQLLQFRGLSSTPFPKLDPPEGKPNLPLVRSPAQSIAQSIHRKLGP